MKKILVVGIILLFFGTSIPVLAQNQDKTETPLTSQFRFAFIFGSVDGVDWGLFHFAVYKYGMVSEFPVLFMGYDRVAHRFRFEGLTSGTISGGLRIGFITPYPYFCCLLAHNVTIHG